MKDFTYWKIDLWKEGEGSPLVTANDLIGAGLSLDILTKACFHHSEFISGLAFEGVNLSGSNCGYSTSPDNMSFNNCELRDASFLGADCERITLAGSLVDNANFQTPATTDMCNARIKSGDQLPHQPDTTHPQYFPSEIRENEPMRNRIASRLLSAYESHASKDMSVMAKLGRARDQLVVQWERHGFHKLKTLEQVLTEFQARAKDNPTGAAAHALKTVRVKSTYERFLTVQDKAAGNATVQPGVLEPAVVEAVAVKAMPADKKNSVFGRIGASLFGCTRASSSVVDPAESAKYRKGN
jgi:hypothetical protein